MPITIPADLPAFDVLAREGVMVMTEERAARQDIRPLQIGLLNLMPHKIQTEIQFARLIGATPLQIELTLIRMSEHQSRHTSVEHMQHFYRPFRNMRDRRLDGLVITGAPIEHLDFAQVTYWDEMLEVLAWTQSNVHCTFGVCWGGMAMLYHFHGINKTALETKLSGCFRHRNCAPTSPYLRGFSDDCVIPVSRWTTIEQQDIDATPAGLQTLLASDVAGPCLIADPRHRALYILNHFEYDSGTLRDEYERDRRNGTSVTLPLNYFPDDDPRQVPLNRWRSHAHLLYGNWIGEIYQTTPFDSSKIGMTSMDLRG